MCPGNPLGDHGQRAIALAVIFETVLAYEDGMGVSAPPPHQARAGLQHAAGVERTSALLELSRHNPKAAPQGAARGRVWQGVNLPMVNHSNTAPVLRPQSRSRRAAGSAAGAAVKATYDRDNLFHINQNIAPANRS